MQTGTKKQGKQRRDDSLFAEDEAVPQVFAGSDAPAGVPGEKQRFSLEPQTRTICYLGLGTLLAFIAVLFAPSFIFNVNNHDLSLAWVLETTGRNAQNIFTFLTGGGAYGSIDFKIFRYIIVAFAGAALAMSGTAFQGSLKNQLASPSTLGVMSGAQLGSVLFVLFAPLLPALGLVQTDMKLMGADGSGLSGLNPVEYLFAAFSQSLATLAGSAIVTCLVLLISYLAGHGKFSRGAMVITGQVIASFVGTFIVFVRMYVEVYGTPAQLDAISYTMLGGFSLSFTLLSLVVVCLPLAICMGILMTQRTRLNLLAFGEEEARSMGISVTSTRVALVACCTVMTAVVVAFCGPVGFIGFIVPHFTRRIVGPDFKYLIPASGLMGALLLLVVYYAFTVFSIPTGSLSTVTTVIGAFAFVWILLKQRRSGNASW